MGLKCTAIDAVKGIITFEYVPPVGWCPFPIKVPANKSVIASANINDDWYTIYPPIQGTFPVADAPKVSFVPDDKFPHKCPRCGEECYIGTSVEHRRPEKDKTCK